MIFVGDWLPILVCGWYTWLPFLVYVFLHYMLLTLEPELITFFFFFCCLWSKRYQIPFFFLFSTGVTCSSASIFISSHGSTLHSQILNQSKYFVSHLCLKKKLPWLNNFSYWGDNELILYTLLFYCSMVFLYYIKSKLIESNSILCFSTCPDRAAAPRPLLPPGPLGKTAVVFWRSASIHLHPQLDL